MVDEERHDGRTARPSRWYMPLGYAVGTLGAGLTLATVLALLGRVLWCQRGLGFWTWDAASPCTSQHFGDPYSLTHITHGVLFYALLMLVGRQYPLSWRYFAALAIETGWEIVENTPWIIERYRTQTASLGYFGDSILNSLGDLLFAGLGFALAARLPTKVTIGLCLAMELLLLATIRDNLTLNVLTLLLPLPGVQRWQLGQ